MDGYFVGIDPGLSGAIVWLDAAGGFVDVADLPVCGRLLDPAQVVDLLRRRPILLAALEKPGGYGEHPRALFSLGTSMGICYAGLVAVGARGILAPPAAWKARMLVTKEKDTSVAAAKRRLPGLPLFRSARCTTESHDRAEAGLLALYARAAHLALSPDSESRVSDLPEDASPGPLA